VIGVYRHLMWVGEEKRSPFTESMHDSQHSRSCVGYLRSGAENILEENAIGSHLLSCLLFKKGARSNQRCIREDSKGVDQIWKFENGIRGQSFLKLFVRPRLVFGPDVGHVSGKQGEGLNECGILRNELPEVVCQTDDALERHLCSRCRPFFDGDDMGGLDSDRSFGY